MATCIGSLTRACIITGWQLPVDDTYRKALYSEFNLMLKEKYKTVNQEEIAYAMRKFGTKIKDWGKNVNLSLICETLDLYLKERSEISKEEEYKKLNNIETKSLPMGDVDWSNEWEDIKTGKTKIIPTLIYDWGIKKGLIILSVEEKIELVKRASKNLILASGELKLPDAELISYKNNLKDLKNILVINEAKRIAVREAAQKQK